MAWVQSSRPPPLASGLRAWGTSSRQLGHAKAQAAATGAPTPRREELPHVQGQGQKPGGPHAEGQRWRGVTPRLRSGQRPRVPDCDGAGMAERSYPTSEVRGSGREEIPSVRGQGQRPRVPDCDGAGTAERSYPTSEVRGGEGGGREELPRVRRQGWQPEGAAPCPHARGQGRPLGGPTPHPRSGGCTGAGGPRGAIPR